MAIERWAIRDAGIAHFFNIETGQLKASLPTLKTAGIEFSGETVYARGGLGNPKLVGFSGNREGSIALQDAIFDNKALAMLTGNDPAVAVAQVDVNEVVVVGTSAATIKNTPIGTLVGVYGYNPGTGSASSVEYTEGAPVSNELEYSLSGKEITFNDAVADGTQIMVYYIAETDNQATSIKVTSDKFGGTFRFALDCQVVDQVSQKVYKAQVRVPVAKFEDNFSFNLSVDGDPAVLDLNLEVLKSPASTDMYTMVIYDEETLA